MKKFKFSLNFDLQPFFKLIQSNLATIDPEQLKAYIYVVLTLFTVSFFGVFAISPTLNTVSNLDKQYEDNLIIYDALTKKLDSLRRLDAQFESIEPNVNFIYAAIPKSAQIPYLTRQIENLAASNNLQVSKLSFGAVEIFPNVKTDTMYSFVFTVALIGSRSDANNFIKDIINFDRIIGIEKITTGTDEERQYNLTLSGRAFFTTK
jgi:Tfp pilus assembly protein PilO